jgi:hypothetical protein
VFRVALCSLSTAVVSAPAVLRVAPCFVWGRARFNRCRVRLLSSCRPDASLLLDAVLQATLYCRVTPASTGPEPRHCGMTRLAPMCSTWCGESGGATRSLCGAARYVV